MSGTLPTVQYPSSATLTSVQPSRMSVSHSLKRQVRTSNVQRWALAMSFPPMVRSIYMQFYAFLIKQRGQFDTFTCTLPGYEKPQGTWAGTPVVNGGGQTGRAINLSGFSASQPYVVKAGDIFKFAGHSKVYMATADASSDGAGLATVSLEPALMASPAADEALVASEVPFTVALTSDTQDLPIASGLQPTALSISMVEVF